MIKRIDIPSFGSFEDFVWKDSVRNAAGSVEDLRRLNILYGRNYAGKTTLSRILRCLETEVLPPNLRNPIFRLTTDSGVIDQTAIASQGLEVRVYNKDFVDENLGFLRDCDGKITPFAIVGSENRAIEEKIAKAIAELGSVDEESGLRFKHAEKHAELVKKSGTATSAESTLKAKLTAKATQQPGGIKHNPIYRDPNYNTPKIEADIRQVRSKSIEPLDEDGRDEREALLREIALPDIAHKLQFSATIEGLYSHAEALVSKRIVPSRPLQELLEDSVLQAWVKSGIEHHRDKRTTCGFCGQELPSDLWVKLDAHFSKESDDLRDALRQHGLLIDQEAARVQGILSLSEDAFYATQRRTFREHKALLEAAVTNYVTELETMKHILQTREDDIFASATMPKLGCTGDGIVEESKALNALIVANNHKTESLATDQTAARKELRLSEIAQFIHDIGLTAEEERIVGLKKQADEVNEEAQSLAGQVLALEDEVRQLQTQLKDESKGATKVNDYLNHFFGHEGLRLEAVKKPGNPAFEFEIFRGDEPAYNLSEGECSLVAFCYFMARLEDAETKGKELVVYIDDPVSSLDGNHIFFVFSLIESVLGKPDKNPDGSNRFRYRQLFVSTHNLDFFKYLKRLSQPTGTHGGTAYFLIERGCGGSQITPMPAYLRDYATEFNYLFGQVYKCRNDENARENHECFYSFGNNLRKFLEAYLFYKYPCQEDQNDATERLKKFFGDDPASTALTTRLTNELSHLEQIFDRSMRPIEVPEIPKLANFVLDKIFEKDPDQFNALLKSIGEPPREPVAELTTSTDL